MMDVLDSIWDRVVGGMVWLKQLIIGEFSEDRPMSVVIADMLVSFIPGVVIVTSARDLAAVSLRLGKRYTGGMDSKEAAAHAEWSEWVLIIACAIPLIMPVLAAAVGAAAAGVGAIVGGLVGDELGAFLRALCLLLIRDAEVLLRGVVEFLGKFTKGNIVKILSEVRFAVYESELIKYVKTFLDGLIDILKELRSAAEHVTWFDSAKRLIARLEEMERWFYAVQHNAAAGIPKALGELQKLLDNALQQDLHYATHTASAGVRADKPAVAAAAHQPRITSGVGEKPRPMESRGAGDGAGGGGGGGELPKPPVDPQKGPNVHEPELKARIGERRISQERYKKLRGKTPSAKIRDMVNEGKTPPYPDPALPGKMVTGPLQADHIVSMDKITRMDGFDKLTEAQQVAVLNNPDNFIGLSPAANASKGARSFEDWLGHQASNTPVDPEFRQQMMGVERSLEGKLQQQIDDFVKLGNQ